MRARPIRRMTSEELDLLMEGHNYDGLVPYQTVDHFLDYIEDLTSDLKESGSIETAKDFETLRDLVVYLGSELGKLKSGIAQVAKTADLPHPQGGAVMRGWNRTLARLVDKVVEYQHALKQASEMTGKIRVFCDCLKKNPECTRCKGTGSVWVELIGRLPTE